MGSKTQLPATIRAFPVHIPMRTPVQDCARTPAVALPALGFLPDFHQSCRFCLSLRKTVPRSSMESFLYFKLLFLTPQSPPHICSWEQPCSHTPGTTAQDRQIARADLPTSSLHFEREERKKKRLLTTTEWVFNLLRSISVKGRLETFFFPQLAFAMFLSLLLLSSASLAFIWWPVVIEGSPTDPPDLHKLLLLCHGEALLDFSSLAWQGC